MVPAELELVPVVCQLEKYQPIPWLMRDTIEDPPVKTPSEWFSKKWPRQADTYGTPFLEAKYFDDNQGKHVNPIALNDIFFASILAGDENLGHGVVYCTPEDQWYFRDPADGNKFKPTSEAKLTILLSRYLLQCAEELKDPTPKFNLFVRFRKHEELQKVINKAKSLLAVDQSFFAADSPNIRTGEGAEKERAAKTFINVVIELNPQKSLTVTDSYTAFREFCVKNGLMLVERRLYQDLVREIIVEQYGLSLRNDVPNESGRHQRGWRGLGLRHDQLVGLGLEKN